MAHIVTPEQENGQIGRVILCGCLLVFIAITQSHQRYHQ